MSPKGDLPLAERLERIEQKIDKLTEHVTVLRVKASAYGAAAGSVFGFLVAVAVAYLRG